MTDIAQVQPLSREGQLDARQPVRLCVSLELAGKTATGFEVPPDVVLALGAGKRPPIRVTIAGHVYRTTVGSRGGRSMVGVSAENRAAAGVAAGDEVEVRLELDTEPRAVAVPDDLAAALRAAPTAERFFASLSFSQKQWYVLGIEDAKTPETRQRRLVKAIERLEQGRAQR